ncbi:MAG: hypothetical protein RIS76_2070 [Verrucomicrobiota bacterium]|jgi:mono/diheme cytochrome c family protein
MKTLLRSFAVVSVVSAMALPVLRGADVDVSKLPAAAAAKGVTFDKDIKPIFEKSCFKCHGAEKQKGKYRLDTLEAALKAGENGESILKGDSAKSPLVHSVARLDPDAAMPPDGKGDPLTAAQVGLIRAWIDQGAK